MERRGEMEKRGEMERREEMERRGEMESRGEMEGRPLFRLREISSEGGKRGKTPAQGRGEAERSRAGGGTRCFVLQPGPSVCEALRAPPHWRLGAFPAGRSPQTAADRARSRCVPRAGRGSLSAGCGLCRVGFSSAGAGSGAPRR